MLELSEPHFSLLQKLKWLEKLLEILSSLGKLLSHFHGCLSFHICSMSCLPQFGTITAASLHSAQSLIGQRYEIDIPLKWSESLIFPCSLSPLCPVREYGKRRDSHCCHPSLGHPIRLESSREPWLLDIISCPNTPNVSGLSPFGVLSRLF